MPTIVDEMRAAGFDDATIGSWADEQRPAMKEAGFDDATIEGYFSGLKSPGAIPRPFLKRFMSSTSLADAAVEGAKAGFGDTPLGTTEKDRAGLRASGIYNDYDAPGGPQGGPVQYLRMANETVIEGAVTAVGGMFRGVNAGLMGLGAAGGQLVSELSGQDEADQAKARRDVGHLVTFGAMLAGTVSPVVKPGRVVNKLPNDVTLGHLPTAEDFTAVAKIAAKIVQDENSRTVVTINGNDFPMKPAAPAEPTEPTLFDVQPAKPTVRETLAAEIDRRVAEEDAHAAAEAVAAPDLLTQAEQLVRQSGKASTSFVQRNFKLPYEQAAQLIDQLEQNGVVGPPNHAGKREILPQAEAVPVAPFDHVPAQARDKAVRLYEEYGHPPSEVATDMQADPAIARAIVSDDPAELPAAYVGETKPQPVSADKLPPDLHAVDLTKHPDLKATPDEMAEVQELVDRRATPAEIEEHPLIQRAYKLGEEYPKTHEAPGYGTEEYQQNRVFNFNGERVVGYKAAIDRLIERAKSFAPGGKPANERQAYIVTGPGGAGKSTLVADPLARLAKAAVVDADEAKPVMPEYRGGPGATAVHEESTMLTYEAKDSVLQRLAVEGVNMVIGKIGHTPESIRKLRAKLEEAGYEVSLVNLEVHPEEAFRRRIGRFLRTGRVNSSGYKGDYQRMGGNSAAAYYIHRGEGKFNEGLNLDVNTRPVTIKDETHPGGLSSELGLGPGRPRDGTAVGGARSGDPANGGSQSRQGERSQEVARGEYIARALDNLASTSRTAQGTAKAEKLAAGVTGEKAAALAKGNFERVMGDMFDLRNDLPHDGPGMARFIDQVAAKVNAGIIPEGELARTKTTKNDQTRPADLPAAHAAFSEELARRLDDPHADPVETAAWIEWQANFVDHFWADGVGKTSKALAAIPLMRAGLPLPRYGTAKDFFKFAPNKGGTWPQFLDYYRSLNEAPEVAAVRDTIALARGAASQTRPIPEYAPDPLARPDTLLPAGNFMFRAADLNVDAQRFQFKSDANAEGVNKALAGVTQWDTSKAGSVIVWEQKDGKLFIADGHQRTGLARRLEAQGHAPIEVPGVLYREKDGFASRDVMEIAASANIANGSGSALDGARVLRNNPSLVNGTLPLSAGKGKQAVALSKLNDEAFGMVINEVVPEHYGAVVGELIPKDGARQVAALKAIERFGPRNVDEAAALVNRVKAAELAKADKGAQGSMFGDLETAESTAGEEMKIVGRAIADLKKDKTLFSRVVANAERIEQTGSKIEQENAKSVATDAEKFARVLASDAYSAGPIRDVLVAAARELKNGQATIGDSAARVVAALRGAVEDSVAARDGGSGRGEAGSRGSGEGAGERVESAPGTYHKPIEEAGTGFTSEPHAKAIETALDKIEEAVDAKDRDGVNVAVWAARKVLNDVPEVVKAQDAEYWGQFKAVISDMAKEGYVTGKQAYEAEHGGAVAARSGPVEFAKAAHAEAERLYPGTSTTKTTGKGKNKKTTVERYVSNEHIAFNNGAQGYSWDAAMPIHIKEADMAAAYAAGAKWADRPLPKPQKTPEEAKAYFAAIKAEAAASKAKFEAAFATSQHYEMVKGNRRVVIGRNMADTASDAPYRTTSLDEHGPSGHMEFRTVDELAREVWSYEKQGFEHRPRRATEPGADGKPQGLIPGVEPVAPAAPLTVQEQLIAAAERPLRGGDKPAEGLFGNSMNEPQLFDAKPRTIFEQAEDRARGQEILDGPASGEPQGLSAAATADPYTPTPAAILPAGTLVTAARDAAARVSSIWRDIQMNTAPMVLGTPAARAVLKDFANVMRRIRYDWSREDDAIVKAFPDRESRARMWSASDEESVAIQLGESREHQGLVTLTPAERAMVEQLQTRMQATWVQARDVGMVEGESLPSYTPRMLINVATGEGRAPKALNSIGGNVATTSARLRRRAHMMDYETEAAGKARFGDDVELARDIRSYPLAVADMEKAIAGRQLINDIREIGQRAGQETVAEGGRPAGGQWFTIDHPAFKTWRPRLERGPERTDGMFGPEAGKWQTVKDAEGNIIFDQVPIHVHKDFEGPIRAVLDVKSGEFYKAAMELKGKTMSVIMNSPLIHNFVEYGRAFASMPGRMITFRVFRDGAAMIADPAQMREAIMHGMVPIGNRAFNQDITSIMEAPELKAGRSLTADALAETFGNLPQKGATRAEVKQSVREGVDQAGNFWHNTLLWDQIAKLQAGLYTNIKADLMAKGVDETTSMYMAAHMSNRYAGAIPKEAMGHGATVIANSLLFSRSFTMGNLGVIKDMITGLPRDVLAQIERDVGTIDSRAVDHAKKIARNKAIAIVITDIVLFHVLNSLLQSVINVVSGRKDTEQELKSYADRMGKQFEKVKETPSALLHPLAIMEGLSSTSENEPGKRSHVYVGNTKDGTAFYLRNTIGKLGEEFESWGLSPLEMLRKKEGTIFRPLMQVMANDKGFGRKIYDPQAESYEEMVKVVAAIGAHIALAQAPQGQISAAYDLATGQGDKTLNTLQAFGPILGTTFSKGAPGGQAVGEMYAWHDKHKFMVDAKLPGWRRQIQNGDAAGAVTDMTQMGIPKGLVQFYVRTALYPATRLTARAMKDFYTGSTPDQRSRMEDALRRQPPGTQP